MDHAEARASARQTDLTAIGHAGDARSMGKPKGLDRRLRFLAVLCRGARAAAEGPAIFWICARRRPAFHRGFAGTSKARQGWPPDDFGPSRIVCGQPGSDLHSPAVASLLPRRFNRLYLSAICWDLGGRILQTRIRAA